jgi:hypothetical protein
MRAVLHAFGCCFFNDDGSICPLWVRAGKTHCEVEAALRLSSRAATRLVNGIERRAFAVFPKGICIAPSRICSHTSR